MIALIARSKNGVIGSMGGLPWHCSEDLKFFKRMTEGKVLIMGSKTYMDLPLIKDRHIKVLTRNITPALIQKYDANQEAGQDKVSIALSINGCTVFIHEGLDYSLGDLMKIEDLVLCGGAQIYSQFIHLCSEVYVSVINIECSGDTFFDDGWLDGFQHTSSMKISEELTVRRYQKPD